MNIRKAARNALPFLRHRMPSDVKTKKKEEARQRRWCAQNTEGQKKQRKIKKKKRTPKKYHQNLRMSEILSIFAQNLEVQHIFGRF